MTYEEANQRYLQLTSARQAGHLTEEQFNAALAELRVQDGQGAWWQLSAQGQWLQWNGVSWAAPASAAAGAVRQVSADQAIHAARQAQQLYSTAQAVASGNVAGAVAGVAGRLSPLANKSSKWWSVMSVLGGGAGGGLWYWYSTLDKFTKPDPVTALIMLLVPVVLIILRRPIDRMLLPLMPIRQKIPRLLIVGVGVAAPYFVASFLYDSMQISNYPLIRWAVFLGPLVSYIIIRTPDQASVRSGGRI